MIIKSKFKPAWWLPGPHLQTMWPTSTRRSPDINIQRERIELPDGDFVDVDWAHPNHDAANTPIILILHGLGGSIESHYAKHTLKAIIDQGWRGALLNFRGCSGMPNRLPRGYHSGETGDTDYIVKLFLDREPNTPVAAVGYSLGGNVLLKWLGETNSQNPLTTAIAISAPFQLENAANRLLKGTSRIYQWWLLRSLRDYVRDKFKLIESPIDLSRLDSHNTLWEFDTHISAPLHGFKDAKDYYTKASSRQFLKHIARPTLILHSTDDPFMTPLVVPDEEELSEHIILELSDKGGHVGFTSGNIPFKARYWLDERIVEHLQAYFDSFK